MFEDYYGILGIYAAYIIVWFIIAVLIGVWVYNDAEKRGRSGGLWLLICFFIGIIGLFIWWIVRPPIQPETKDAGLSKKEIREMKKTAETAHIPKASKIDELREKKLFLQENLETIYRAKGMSRVEASKMAEAEAAKKILKYTRRSKKYNTNTKKKGIALWPEKGSKKKKKRNIKW